MVTYNIAFVEKNGYFYGNILQKKNKKQVKIRNKLIVNYLLKLSKKHIDIWKKKRYY